MILNFELERHFQYKCHYICTGDLLNFISHFDIQHILLQMYHKFIQKIFIKKVFIFTGI